MNERLGEAGAAAVDLGLDGTEGKREPIRHFFVGELLEVAEHDRAAPRGWQRLECPPQPLCAFSRVERFSGAAGRADPQGIQPSVEDRRERRLEPPTPEVVDAPVAARSIHPHIERLWAIERRQPLHQANKDVLRKILGIGGIPSEEARQTDDSAPLALEQLRDGIGVAGRGLRHQGRRRRAAWGWTGNRRRPTGISGAGREFDIIT